MCVKDSNYNWATTRQNLSSLCPTKLDSNQFTQLQRLARKMRAVAQTYLFTYVSSNQQCERSILKSWILIIILLVIPAANATSERTFSALRRVKTYLRSTMTQTRMNNLITLHVHKERTDAPNLKAIASSLQEMNHQSACLECFNFSCVVSKLFF